jgi:hypothetical protein
VVEEAAGAGEIRGEFFFGEKFGGIGEERGAGTMGGMFDVECFVVEGRFGVDLDQSKLLTDARFPRQSR